MNPPHDGGRARAPRGPLRRLVAAATVSVVALAVCALGWWRSATDRNRQVKVSQADAGETLASPNVQDHSSDGATDLGGVQLWKDGPYWAECNVGAQKPEESGYYFWWGDTVGYRRVGESWQSVDGLQRDFTFDANKCPTWRKDITQLRADGYIDVPCNLVAAYDAATKHLGTPWRTPTRTEINLLLEKCTYTLTRRNGVQGLLVSGKGDFALRSIFFPAAGFGCEYCLLGAGESGRYWSSTPDSDNSWLARCFTFASSGFSEGDRSSGCSVRPLRGFAK